MTHEVDQVIFSVTLWVLLGGAGLLLVMLVGLLFLRPRPIPTPQTERLIMAVIGLLAGVFSYVLWELLFLHQRFEAMHTFTTASYQLKSELTQLHELPTALTARLEPALEALERTRSDIRDQFRLALKSTEQLQEEVRGQYQRLLDAQTPEQRWYAERMQRLRELDALAP